MKSFRACFIAAALVAAGAAAQGTPPFQTAANARLPGTPALYSFADVYRLTVRGAAMADFPLQDSLVRVALSPASAETQFSISAVPQPERWLLIVSGLLAAAWVARRRLGYAT